MGILSNLINPCKHDWEVLEKKTKDGSYTVVSRCKKCDTLKKQSV